MLRGWPAAILLCFRLTESFRLPEETINLNRRQRSLEQLRRNAGLPSSAAIDLHGSRWTPAGWVYERWQQGKRAYFDIHIPKTAGCSFSVDVESVLAPGEGYYSMEACWGTERPMLPGDVKVATLRKPMSHVYSQFLECKYDDWGTSVVPKEDAPLLTNVTTWLKHFQSGSTYDMNCYHPYNMQTRALTCNSYWCHNYTGEELSLGNALENLDSLFFVGLVEHYQASLCLFFAKTQVGQPLPFFCDCRNKTAWSTLRTTHETHNVPPHSLANLTEEDQAIIRELTQLDEAVYEAAWNRFKWEADEVHKRTGTQILCYNNEHTKREMADLQGWGVNQPDLAHSGLTDVVRHHGE